MVQWRRICQVNVRNVFREPCSKYIVNTFNLILRSPSSIAILNVTAGLNTKLKKDSLLSQIECNVVLKIAVMFICLV